MTISGIAHCAYNVTDMQASLDFYVGKLGMKHAFSLTRSDGTPWIEYIKVAPGQFVELFYAENPFDSKSCAYNHLCLQVPSCKEAEKQLIEAGIAIDVPLKQGSDGNWQLWIHDPDGNRVEIMEISPLSPQANA